MRVVANSFDSWQKDAFFSAAEEVQQSADIMESVYRTWKRMNKIQQDQSFCRDLQTALGTTKWQLDEFERAVRSSYMNNIDDTTTSSHMLRHRQFIDAIGTQILKVETELRDWFVVDGKTQPLRWVHLDEDDCEDLAAFLSGSVSTTRIQKDGYCTSSSCGIVLEDSSDSSTNCKLEIVVGGDDDERKDKERGFNWLEQIIRRQRQGHRQLQLQTPLSFQFPSSRFMFGLLLIVFLMVPFLLLST